MATTLAFDGNPTFPTPETPYLEAKGWKLGMGHILTSEFSSSLPLQQGLTPLDVARDRRHSDICEELEKYLTTETKETQYQEPDSEIQKPDSEEHLTTESQEAHSPPQQSHSGTTEPDSEEPLTTESQEPHSLTPQSHSETTGPDSEEPLMTESQEAHSLTQQSHSGTTEPDSETLKSQQPPGVEETTPKGVLPETESNRSKV